MKLSNSKAFAVVLSLLLALSVCVPLMASPIARASASSASVSDFVYDGSDRLSCDYVNQLDVSSSVESGFLNINISGYGGDNYCCPASMFRVGFDTDWDSDIPVSSVVPAGRGYTVALALSDLVEKYALEAGASTSCRLYLSDYDYTARLGFVSFVLSVPSNSSKSTISLAAAGAPVANPVAYNVYKLFDADVQDGKACNVRYFYRTKETMGTLKVGYKSPKQSIVERANACVGMPYQFGGCSPAGFDASGFVSYCVTGQYNRLGSTAQFFGSWERTSNPEPGDICANSGTCGVYIGNGLMVHGVQGAGFTVKPVQAGMVYLVAPSVSAASAVSLASVEASSSDDLKSAQEDAEFIKEHIADGSTLGADSFGMSLARSVAASYASFGFVNSEPPAACPAGGIMVSPAVAALLGGDSGTITVEGIDDDGNAKKLENVSYAVSADCPDDKIIASAEVSAVLHDKGGASLLRADGSKVPVPSNVPTVKSDGVPVEVDGPGYYLVVDPDILTGDNTAASSPIFVLVGEGNTEIKEKSAIPTLTKSVKEDSTGEYGDDADATLQQSVGFRLVGTLPSNLASYEKYFYAFHDEVNGLSGAPDALSVSIDGVAVDSSKYVVNVSENGFSVVFADLLSCGVPVSASSSVVVEYSAAPVVAGIATNVAYVEYSNNSMNEGSHGTTVRNEVNVYSYALNFHKVDNATSEPLAGVCFTIKNAAGKYMALNAAGVFESDDVYTWTTDAAGDIKIEGVDADTYTVEEVSTLADYKLLAAPFDVSIDAFDKSTVVVSVLNDPAYVSSHEGAIEVRNVKTFELPNTGQLGFVGLLAAGFLVLGGTLVYEIRRRRDAEEV